MQECELGCTHVHTHTTRSLAHMHACARAHTHTHTHTHSHLLTCRLFIQTNQIYSDYCLCMTSWHTWQSTHLCQLFEQLGSDASVHKFTMFLLPHLWSILNEHNLIWKFCPFQVKWKTFSSFFLFALRLEICWTANLGLITAQSIGPKNNLTEVKLPPKLWAMIIYGDISSARR